MTPDGGPKVTRVQSAFGLAQNAGRAVLWSHAHPEKPLLNSMFFEYSMRLDRNLPRPIEVYDSVDISIWAWEVVRYKYKFFAANKVSSNNNINNKL